MIEIDEIAVPVDGSEGSSRAAEFAARLAAATGKPLRLLYVFPATPMALIGLASMSAEHIKQAEADASREIFAKARAAIADAGVDSNETILLGDPAHELIGYVNQNPKSMLVMGRRGLSKIQSLLLGSVSEKVARHAHGAVTLVN
jgi:nucleotide-binding universal stress UspA family protein